MGDSGETTGARRDNHIARVSPVTRLLEAAVVIAAVATIPLVFAFEEGVHDPLLENLDWGIWSIFVVDYVALGLVSANRARYVRQNWIGLAIIVLSFPLLPYFLDVVRLARILQVIRLLRIAAAVARGAGALRMAIGRPGMIYMALLTGLLIMAGGAILALLEPETVKHDIWNGVWWAVVTTSTVGYGDIAPVSAGGRVLGAILMITGIGLVATLAASISAHFVAEDERKLEEAENTAILERLDRLEALVRELRSQGPDVNGGHQPLEVIDSVGPGRRGDILRDDRTPGP